MPADPDGLTPQEVVTIARGAAPAGTIATIDAGAHMLPAVPLWEVEAPGELLISNGLATMGFALPAAIAAALVEPSRHVVCFTGDGGLGIALAELETLARLNGKVIVVVFNDAALSLIAIKQSADGHGGPAAVSYARTDFAAVAAGFGIARRAGVGRRRLSDRVRGGVAPRRPVAPRRDRRPVVVSGDPRRRPGRVTPNADHRNYCGADLKCRRWPCGGSTPRRCAAWRAYVETVFELNAALEADLAEHGLTLGDYQVLVFLSEADGRAMRMCDLAARLQLSPSGLTRRLDGLVRAGVVERRPSETDRRVMLAVLTPPASAGSPRRRRRTPRSVRARIFDQLDRRDIAAMERLFTAIHEGLHADESARMLAGDRPATPCRPASAATSPTSGSRTTPTTSWSSPRRLRCPQRASSPAAASAGRA